MLLRKNRKHSSRAIDAAIEAGTTPIEPSRVMTPPSYHSPRDTPTIEMVGPDGNLIVRKCKANLRHATAMQILMGHMDPPEENWADNSDADPGLLHTGDADDQDEEDNCPPLQSRDCNVCTSVNESKTHRL